MPQLLAYPEALNDPTSEPPTRDEWRESYESYVEIIAHNAPLTPGTEAARRATAILLRGGHLNNRVEGQRLHRRRFAGHLANLVATWISHASERDAEAELEQAIAKSREILKIRQDPETGADAGYDEAVWNEAVGLLRRMATAYRQITGELLPAPSINPADSGSIDLYWRVGGDTLLVNVPGEGSPPTFFGRRKAGTRISGTHPAADGEFTYLAQWLAEQGEPR